jgi:hypothetical protein
MRLAVDVPGNGEVIHEDVVEGVVVGVENHHNQIGADDQGRVEGVTGLRNEDFIILAEVAREGCCSLAVASDGLIGVGVDVVDIVDSCPFHTLLELDGSFPSERQGIREHAAVTHSAQNTVSNLLAAHWVGNCLSQGDCKQGEDAE